MARRRARREKGAMPLRIVTAGPRGPTARHDPAHPGCGSFDPWLRRGARAVSKRTPPLRLLLAPDRSHPQRRPARFRARF